jgi:hypothetical protein
MPEGGLTTLQSLEDTMKTRLKVTEAERLRYSRRLRALSRLREAGIEPMYSMYKEHPLPTSGRRGYRVTLPDGSDFYFQRLADIEAFAADYQLWQQAQARPLAIRACFPAWQSDPMQRMLALVTAGLGVEEQASMPVYQTAYVSLPRAECSWPGCRHLDDGTLERRALCAAHALIYGQMLVAAGKPPAP